MKIYKIVLLLILAVYLNDTNAQKKVNGFVINGHISGIKDNVSIRLIDIDGQRIIDSARSINGTFILKGMVEEPTGCWIECKDKYTTVMVENTAMKYTADFNGMGLYAKVTGGREQKLRNKLKALQLPYDKLCIEASDSLKNGQDLDKKTKEALVNKYNTNGDISQSIYVEFGKKNPNSFLGLDIIYRNRKDIGVDSIKILYNKLSKQLKSTGKGEALRIFFSETLVKKGSPFVDFNANTIDGNSFKLSSLKGKYILLSFGSAGCVPCRWENKTISENYESLKSEISFVSFSLDKTKETWIKASEIDKITWTNISDLKGEKSPIKVLYNVQSIPLHS